MQKSLNGEKNQSKTADIKRRNWLVIIVFEDTETVTQVRKKVTGI